MAKIKESEHDIQASILDYLERRRIFCYRQNTGALPTESKGRRYYVRYGTPGAPDILAVISGIYVGIEVKSEKGIQSDVQKDFQARLEAAGGIYFVARSFDSAMEFVNNAIIRLGKPYNSLKKAGK